MCTYDPAFLPFERWVAINSKFILLIIDLQISQKFSIEALEIDIVGVWTSWLEDWLYCLNWYNVVDVLSCG